MSRPRIVFLPGDVRFGLTWINTACLCAMKPLADRRGIQVRVLIPRNEQNPGLQDRLRAIYSSQELIDVEEWRYRAAAVHKLMAAEGPHIVQVQGIRDVKAMIAVKKQYGHAMPLVVTTHSFRHGCGRIMRTVSSLVQSWYYKKYVDYTIFQTSATADIFSGAGRLLKGKSAGFIPLGVEDSILEIQRPEHEVGDPDLRPIVTTEGRYFVYLANFSRNKGHRWLLDAMASKLSASPDYRVVLAGEGPERALILSEAEALGLAKRVICPGRIDRCWVPWLLHKARAAVVASQHETFGHNFIEPMSMGIPVIGTPTGVGKLLIHDFLTGFCVPYGDTQAFRKAFEFLVDHPEEATWMGANAQKMVSVWTWDHVARAYLNLYEFLWEQNHLAEENTKENGR